MNDKPKKGSQIGDWKLTKFLGKGGNAKVWLAENKTYDLGAIKIPSIQKSGAEEFERFRGEVELLKLLQDDPGVLTILDSNLDTNTAPAYHVTQVAHPLSKWRKEQHPLEEVVYMIAEVAEILARLSEKEIFHRDLKPDNIFYFDRHWALGDLGLATYPGKEAFTKDNRGVGAADYIADEMKNNPSTAAPGPADIYSLAKMLWVCATGQNRPLNGHHPLDFTPAHIGSFVDHKRSHTLDRLLARATEHDPSKRPTMVEVATELQAWLDFNESSAFQIENPEGYRTEFESLATTIEDERRSQNTLADELLDEAKKLKTWLDPVYDSLRKALPDNVVIQRNLGNGKDNNRLAYPPKVPGQYYRHSVDFQMPGRNNHPIVVSVNLKVQPTENGMQEVQFSGTIASSLGVEHLRGCEGNFHTGSATTNEVRKQFELVMAENVEKLLSELRRLMIG